MLAEQTIRMAEDITSSGSDVLLGAAVRTIHYHGPNDFEVFYVRDGQEQSVRGNAIVSTIPLGFLAQIITPVGWSSGI